MSGHNKWSTIKRKKEASDARRGAAFTKITKIISLAARAGGADHDMNPALRAAIDKAKAVNMPKDNIEKAIKKGVGDIPGVVYENYLYEGYGPHGIAVMIDAVTDNKNRTTAEIRHVLTKNGGSLGESNCVLWNFEKKGMIFIEKGKAAEDFLFDIAIESGADDMKTTDDGFYVYCNYKQTYMVGENIKAQNIEIESMEITYIAQNLVKLGNEETKKILNFLDTIDELDDVQSVYSNIDIPDNIV